MTKQPKWEQIGTVGDANPLEYGGGIVYRDQTGVYADELELIEPDSEQHESPVTVYRIPLERLYLNRCECCGKESLYTIPPERFHDLPHPVHSYNEWFVDKLAEVSASAGMTEAELRETLESADSMRRTFGYETLIQHFGADEFDHYPLKLSYAEATERYKAK